MAIIAAQTIDWANPANMPQSQAVSFATSSMFLITVHIENLVAAPEPYGTIAPAPPPPGVMTFG